MNITEEQATNYYNEFKSDMNLFINNYRSHLHWMPIDWESVTMKAFCRFCNNYDPNNKTGASAKTFLHACLYRERRTIMTTMNYKKRSGMVHNIDDCLELCLCEDLVFDMAVYEEKLSKCSERAKKLFKRVLEQAEQIVGESFEYVGTAGKQDQIKRNLKSVILAETGGTYEWEVRVPIVEIRKAFGWDKKENLKLKIQNLNKLKKQGV